MSRYAIDPMGVASLSGEISNTMRDVEAAVFQWAGGEFPQGRETNVDIK